MTDDENLQAWLDDQSATATKEEEQRKLDEKQAWRNWGSWEEQKFNFKVELYRKAIGA